MSDAAADVLVVVVGGASALCDDRLQGAACVARPEHAAVANAVGAAIPQVCAIVLCKASSILGLS